MVGGFSRSAVMLAVAVLAAAQVGAQQSTRPAQWSLEKGARCSSQTPCGAGADAKAFCLSVLESQARPMACVGFVGLVNIGFAESSGHAFCKADALYATDGSCPWYQSSFTYALAEHVFPYCEVQLSSRRTVRQPVRLAEFSYVCVGRGRFG